MVCGGAEDVADDPGCGPFSGLFDEWRKGDLRSKTDAEWRAVFARFDADGSGAIDAAELGVALSELFNVHMSVPQREALIATVDANADGKLQPDEFIRFALEYESSLPSRRHFKEADVKFVSFGTSAPLGIEFSVDETFPGLPAVDSVAGVAADAGVPVGALIKYLHDDELALGVPMPELLGRVRALKGRAAFTIGFQMPLVVAARAPSAAGDDGAAAAPGDAGGARAAAGPSLFELLTDASGAGLRTKSAAEWRAAFDKHCKARGGVLDGGDRIAEASVAACAAELFGVSMSARMCDALVDALGEREYLGELTRAEFLRFAQARARAVLPRLPPPLSPSLSPLKEERSPPLPLSEDRGSRRRSRPRCPRPAARPPSRSRRSRPRAISARRRPTRRRCAS